MFTGLIRSLGTIRAIDPQGDRVMTIAMQRPFAIALGDSIACNGICLTATAFDRSSFQVSLSAETLACSTAAQWRVGDLINLEPSLAVGDKLGGHFVSGHVDGMGRAVAATPSGDSVVWMFEAPAALMPYIAPKGSITIDGVSLTVNVVSNGGFSVNIIPHTQQETHFASLRTGDAVNLEIDMLARYVARLRECA